MKLLLDTSAIIWLAAGDRRSRALLPVLNDAASDVFVSQVSVWELAIKHRIGKLALSRPFDDFITMQMLDLSATELAISAFHLAEFSGLPLLHRDPFDALLVAQARVEGMVLVTSDAHIARYDVPVFWRTE